MTDKKQMDFASAMPLVMEGLRGLRDAAFASRWTAILDWYACQDDETQETFVKRTSADLLGRTNSAKAKKALIEALSKME